MNFVMPGGATPPARRNDPLGSREARDEAVEGGEDQDAFGGMADRRITNDKMRNPDCRDNGRHGGAPAVATTASDSGQIANNRAWQPLGAQQIFGSGRHRSRRAKRPRYPEGDESATFVLVGMLPFFSRTLDLEDGRLHGGRIVAAHRGSSYHRLNTDGRMRREWMMALLASLAAAGTAAAQSAASCAPDNVDLKLPSGFCASVYADSMAQPRQIAVAPNGDIFVSSMGGRGTVGGVFALRGQGRAEVKEHIIQGRSAHLAWFDNHLYVELEPQGGRGQGQTGPAPTVVIVRYPMKVGELRPAGPPDTIVQGIPYTPGHSTRNFAIARDGSLYLNIGSATNNCSNPDRVPRTPGVNPCVELETRAGIWKFDARKKNQTPSAANHFARGIRNAVGIAINPADQRLYATQHGRDDLQGWFAQLGMDSVAALKYGAENPAEVLLQVNQGDDFGWPYCYYSVVERKLVQAPEYGGDGKKVGDCASKKGPVATFPGHWAPNGLFFYTGSALPAKYRNGAFIAFHGSWNRAPEPQAGYNVVFQPLRDGQAVGGYEIFADNFAPNLGRGGRGAGTGARRPSAVAQAGDGALLVADDAGSRIYKIWYTGK